MSFFCFTCAHRNRHHIIHTSQPILSNQMFKFWQIYSPYICILLLGMHIPKWKQSQNSHKEYKDANELMVICVCLRFVFMNTEPLLSLSMWDSPNPPKHPPTPFSLSHEVDALIDLSFACPWDAVVIRVSFLAGALKPGPLGGDLHQITASSKRNQRWELRSPEHLG